MKKKLIFNLFLGVVCFGMNAQIDTLGQRMISMNATVEKPYKVGSVYYKKGESKPFTGVLFGKYNNGKYLSIQEYKDGIGNGKWVNYYVDGTVKEIGTYNDNRVDGPIEQFHPNGRLKAKGTYKHWRKKTGVWFYYDMEGAFIKKVKH
jgi:antitoxin component YwqK of YwqJK toxin-antitoxin module